MGYNGERVSLEIARRILMGAGVAPVTQLSPLTVSPSVVILRKMCSDGLPVYRAGDDALAGPAQITAEALASLYVKGADFERAIQQSGPNRLPLLRLGAVLGGSNGRVDMAGLESRL